MSLTPLKITPAHWDRLAKECDIRSRFLVNLVAETAALLQENLVATKETFEARFGDYPALQRIEQIVTKQCHGIAK